MKIVINAKYGGFGLSEAVFNMVKKANPGNDWERDWEVPRDNPELVRLVETLGSDVCSGESCQLAIVEIPDDVEWCVVEYDGLEHVAEKHRTWHAK